VAGNIAMPVAVLAGFLKEAPARAETPDRAGLEPSAGQE
jgi:hypothetical protein